MNAQGGQRDLLNPSQQNSLRITLLLVEKGMLDMERLLAVGEYHGILFRVTDDLGDDATTEIWQLIQEVRDIIRELKNRSLKTIKRLHGIAPIEAVNRSIL